MGEDKFYRIWFIITLLMLTGCKSVKYIPVESVRTDSIVITRHKTDSVYVRDSIATVIKGDTVTVDRTKYIYKYLNYTDTCYVERTDSVRVPYPVEKELTRWQRMKIDFSGYVLFTVSVFFILWIWRIKRER